MAAGGASFSLSDIYGANAAVAGPGVANPAPDAAVVPSGNANAQHRQGAPAWGWVGIVVVLLVVRFIWEYAEEV